VKQGGGAGNRNPLDRETREDSRLLAQTEATRIDVSARLAVAFGPDDLQTARTVEEALASALEGAAKAGQWNIVAQLARELEARRNAGNV
jgi:hypothetical protein